MGFKKAVADLMEGFLETMQGGEMETLREEFSGILPAGSDPMILHLLGSIAGGLGARGIDPAKLGALVAIIAAMARDATGDLGAVAVGGEVARPGKVAEVDQTARMVAHGAEPGRCRVMKSCRTETGVELYADAVYEFELEFDEELTRVTKVQLYVDSKADVPFWECTGKVFAEAFVVLRDDE